MSKRVHWGREGRSDQGFNESKRCGRGGRAREEEERPRPPWGGKEVGWTTWGERSPGWMRPGMGCIGVKAPHLAPTQPIPRHPT